MIPDPRTIKYENPDDPRPPDRQIKGYLKVMQTAKSIGGYIVRAQQWKINELTKIIDDLRDRLNDDYK